MDVPHVQRKCLMQIHWTVTKRDVTAVRDRLAASDGNLFVIQRMQGNVTGDPPEFRQDEFWRVMLGCLLTTQQRAGPDSPVTRFLRREPFCPGLQDCAGATVEALLKRELIKFGGIRRGDTIARQAQANIEWLESGGWEVLETTFERLREQRARAPRMTDVAEERAAADLVREKLRGFGPKQSRNLWQWLGLTRYEIPIDGRITKWLNTNAGLPVTISAQSLADSGSYELVMSAVHALCAEAGVLPCVFDAAVFASYDRDWRPEEVEY
jgi:hypothetical protein